MAFLLILTVGGFSEMTAVISFSGRHWEMDFGWAPVVEKAVKMSHLISLWHSSL